MLDLCCYFWKALYRVDYELFNGIVTVFLTSCYLCFVTLLPGVIRSFKSRGVITIFGSIVLCDCSIR